MNLIKAMKETSPNMKFGSRSLYSSPAEVEKLTVIPEDWLRKQAEKKKLALQAAKKEEDGESSRPGSK